MAKNRFGTQSKVNDSTIATVENGSVASKAYKAGEHFMRDGAFCTCKQAIASGGVHVKY